MESNRRKWLVKLGMALTGLGLARFKLFAAPATGAMINTGTNNLKQFNHMEDKMKLGAFSVSLNVKDLQASRQFYEALGFTVFAGDMAKRYLIMKNEGTLIGIFQGMFEKTLLTFNPGWDQEAKPLEKFTDVRDIQKHLKSKGIALAMEADESTKGPASIMLADPDGNQILLDQHV